MSARDFDELLSAYLDGEVTPEERAAVEQRLEQSPALRETLDELSEVGDLIRHLPRPRPPVDLPERVLAAISAKPLVASRRGLWSQLRGWQWAALGTVAAAGVTIALVLPNRNPAGRPDLALRDPLPGLKTMAAPAATDFTAPMGESRASGDSREFSVVSPAGPAGGAEATESLASLISHLKRKPEQGEVLRTVEVNAGQTQVLQYTVVDTNEIPGALKTIFADNNLDIIVTETPTPPARSLADNNGSNRWCFYVEGSPEQVGRTLKEIETLPTVAYVDDYGVLAESPRSSEKLEDAAKEQSAAASDQLVRRPAGVDAAAPTVLAPAAPVAAAPGNEAQKAMGAVAATRSTTSQPANEANSEQPPPGAVAGGSSDKGTAEKTLAAPSDPDQSLVGRSKDDQTKLGMGVQSQAGKASAAVANPKALPAPAKADADGVSLQLEGAPALAKSEADSKSQSQRGVTTQLNEDALEQLLGDRPMMNNALQGNGAEARGGRPVELRNEAVQNNAVTNNGTQQQTASFDRGRLPQRRAGGYGGLNPENRRDNFSEQKQAIEANGSKDAEIARKRQSLNETETVGDKPAAANNGPVSNSLFNAPNQQQVRSRAIIILQSNTAPEAAPASPAPPIEK